MRCFSRKDEKPKKVWQPPEPLSASPAKTPPKPPRTFEHESSLPSPQKRVSPGKREASPIKEASPSKRFSPAKASDSPAKAEASPIKRNASPPKKASSPVKSNVSKLNVELLVPEKKPCSTVLTVESVPSPAKSSPSRKSHENEPTKKSVSARLAAWQQKVEKVENDGQSALPTALAKVLTNQEGQGKKLASTWKPRPAERGGMVHSAAKHQKTPSPQKSPAKSPSKMGPGTRSIQEKLVQLQGCWSENSIVEKAREERKQELDAINNRWKNGILKEDREEPQPTPAHAAIPSPPPPPPLDSSTPIGTPKVPSPSKAGATPAAVDASSPAKMLRAKKKDECRDRLRQGQRPSRPSVMDALRPCLTCAGPNFLLFWFLSF